MATKKRRSSGIPKAAPPDLEDRRFEMKVRLKDAAWTLRCMRMPGEFYGLSSLKVCWPDVPANYWTNYAREKVRGRMPAATSEQIGRLDELLGWVVKLSHDDRKFVGMWMMGAAWSAICLRFDIGRTTGWARFNAILDQLAKMGLNTPNISGTDFAQAS